MLFSKSWNLFLDRALYLIVIMIIGAAIGIAGVLILGLLFGGSLFASFKSGAIDPVVLSGAGVLLVLLFGAFVLFVSTWINGSIYSLISAKQKQEIGESLSIGIKHFWPMLWLTILNGLIVLGFTGLFIVPGIYIGVAFMFVYYVHFAEGARGFGALMRSKDLIKGNWWNVFGRFLLLIVGIYAVAILLMLLGELFNAPLLFSVVSQLFSILASVYAMAFSVEMYHELAASKGVHKPEVVGRQWKYAVLSIAGYLMFGLIAYSAGSMFVKLMSSIPTDETPDAEQWQEFLKQIESENGNSNFEGLQDALPVLN
ncbi:TPA: hypothetical protein DCZ32_00580 [Candidatus Uhrbacteria bacterium]|nr:hypothetical protein [Candidatus Uhrbacteria bacterium]